MRERFTSILLVLGFVLAIGAGFLFFHFARAYAPPHVKILVAGQDLYPGDVLGDSSLLYDEVRASPVVIRQMVTAEEFEEWQDAVVASPIYAGEFIYKSRLVKEDNPLAARYYSLGLDDPTMIVKTIPVDPERCPDRIRPGDYVDIEVALFSGTYAPSGVSGEKGIKMPQTVHASPYPVAREPLPPLAKATLRNVEVVDVQREQYPAYGKEEELTFVEGEVKAIVVKVPREYEEMLTWAVSNGEVYVSLLSPLAGKEAPEPSFGFSLSDFYARFLADRLGLGMAPAASITATAPISAAVSVTTTLPGASSKPAPSTGGQPPAPTATTPVTPGMAAAPTPRATQVAAAPKSSPSTGRQPPAPPRKPGNELVPVSGELIFARICGMGIGVVVLLAAAVLLLRARRKRRMR